MTRASDSLTDTLTDTLDAVAELPPPVPPPLSDALAAELDTLAPVATRRPMRQLAILAGASLAYAGALLAVLSVRRDAGELPMPWLVGAGVAWFLGFTFACAFALVPPDGEVLPRWPRAAGIAALAALGFIALGLVMHPAGPSSTLYGWPRFLRGHTCLELGVAVALVPVVIGAIALRGVLAVTSRWVAAALGAGGGCLGGLLLHLHCRIADPLHIAFMHGGVVGVSAGLSALIVPRVGDRAGSRPASPVLRS